MSTDTVADATESDYTKAEQAHYHEIVERTRAVRAKEAAWESSKEETKAAKAAFDAADKALREFITAGPNPQLQLPLTDGEEWRDATLEEVGLTAAMLKPFAASEDPRITTLGELADWTAEYQLTDIKGIGEKMAEKIEAVLDAYWAAHPAVKITAEEADDAPKEEAA